MWERLALVKSGWCECMHHVRMQLHQLLDIPVSLIIFILETHSRGIPFGQSEDLTNAIRRVLQTYPSDHEIFKEMIQNADDAKATKIHILLK